MPMPWQSRASRCSSSRVRCSSPDRAPVSIPAPVRSRPRTIAVPPSTPAGGKRRKTVGAARSLMGLAFTKMHGIGNDFVVLDCRSRAFALDAGTIARLGDRHTGIGFDQLLTIEPTRDPSCAYYYGIYNSDGSTSGQCGNGVR